MVLQRKQGNWLDAPHFAIPLLIIAVFLAYLPTLWSEFVWDDTALILRDPLIRSPFLIPEGFRHFLFLDATASSFYRPLQRLIFTIAYAAGGFSPWVYHFVSMAIHALATTAFYLFARRFLAHLPSSKPPALATETLALAAALLWAIHPVHTSAVAYASGLADPVAALFGFTGLAILLGEQRLSLPIAGLCFGLAPFAKESGFFLCLLGLLFAAGRFAGLPGIPAPKTRLPFIRAFAQVALPALLMLFLYASLRLTAQNIPPPSSSSTPVQERSVLALRAVAEYAGIFIAPVRLHMERDVRVQAPASTPEFDAENQRRQLQTVLGAVCLVALLCVFLKSPAAARIPLLAAALVYLPISNLFKLNATVAEHWIYVPSAFFLLALAVLFHRWQHALCKKQQDLLAGETSPPRFLPWGINLTFIVIIALFGTLTALRCVDWQNQARFLEANIKSGGNRSRMLTNQAALRIMRGEGRELSDGVDDYREALRLEPDQPFAMLGLANALIRQQSWLEAREWLERAKTVPLLRAEALVNEASLDFLQHGKDRIDLLQEAAEVNQNFWPHQRRYIQRLMERGEFFEAVVALQKVLKRESFRAETWAMLGQALHLYGQHERAEIAFEEAALRDVHFRKPKR